MARSKEKLEARKLRRQGKSIKEIARDLNVSVSSVSGWCKDIILSTEQIRNLQQRVTDPYYGRKLEYLKNKAKEFNEKVNKLKTLGKEEVGVLSKREIFLIGIALYWAEGFKKDCQVGFTNTDVRMIKIFLVWLEECLGVSRSNLIIRVTANYQYEDKISELEQYWSRELLLPIKQFSKPYFQRTQWNKQYENPSDYHGVLRIKVRKSVDILRKIYGYIEGIAEHV